MPPPDKRGSWCLLVQDDTQEGRVHVETVIVALNEAECPKFIHEKVDPGARCANHFRQHLLRYFGKQLLRFGVPCRSERAAKECELVVSRWSYKADRSNPPRFGCFVKAYKTRSGRRKHVRRGARE